MPWRHCLPSKICWFNSEQKTTYFDWESTLWYSVLKTLILIDTNYGAYRIGLTHTVVINCRSDANNKTWVSLLQNQNGVLIFCNFITKPRENSWKIQLEFSTWLLNYFQIFAFRHLLIKVFKISKKMDTTWL